MISSRNLIIASAVTIMVTLATLKTGAGFGVDAPLQGYSDGARHWSTVNYYSDNQGGYQTSAAAWTRQAFKQTRL
jgi:hypothetical protein